MKSTLLYFLSFSAVQNYLQMRFIFYSCFLPCSWPFIPSVSSFESGSAARTRGRIVLNRSAVANPLTFQSAPSPLVETDFSMFQAQRIPVACIHDAKFWNNRYSCRGGRRGEWNVTVAPSVHAAKKGLFGTYPLGGSSLPADVLSGGTPLSLVHICKIKERFHTNPEKNRTRSLLYDSS
jgi:hypothetical protein